MTRENYIQNRNKNSIGIEDLYEYYKKFKNELSLDQFEQLFQLYLSQGGNLNGFWRNHDVEFQVTKIQTPTTIMYR